MDCKFITTKEEAKVFWVRSLICFQYFEIQWKLGGQWTLDRRTICQSVGMGRSHSEDSKPKVS
jgi:hypothetical protein